MCVLNSLPIAIPRSIAVMYPRLARRELLDADPLPSLEEFEKKTFYGGPEVAELPKHYYYHRWWEQADRYLEKGQ